VIGFLQVCEDGELYFVKAVMERTQADLEARDEYDRTPLLRAAQYGHLRVVQYLCEQGADKEARGECCNSSLLMAAEGHLPSVKYLCEQGDGPEARGVFEKTPQDTTAQGSTRGSPRCGAVPVRARGGQGGEG